MSGSAQIGNLAVDLTLDTGSFIAGGTQAQRELAKLQEQFARIGEKVSSLGRNLTAGLTVPLVGIGGAVLKVAGDFESSMGALAISTKASADELSKMSTLAVQLGRDSVFGAREAADAMDALAKTGLTATQILGGAAEAAVDLAAAAGTDLEPAATAVSDVINQFKLRLDQLPQVVNTITGAVNESKLSFSDYQLAIAQAGGVAGGLGVDFTDFNVAIAATSSLFASGSDAGTSFKTFLTALSGKSEAASKVVRQMGLEFYDANGSLKSMSEVAQILRDKLGGLSDEAKTQTLSTIFGTDAMRTAIGLMSQGSEGLDRMRASIVATDAAVQSAERMSGFNAQLAQLSGSFEALAIAIGNTGLLTMVGNLVGKIADFVTYMATAHPTLLKVAVGLGVFLAALGPIMMLLMPLAAVVLPLFLARLSPIGMAISAFINPLGTVVMLLARFVAQFAGVAILQTLAPILLRFLGPIGLIYTAFQLWGSDVMPVLSALATQLQETLGPTVQGMVTAFLDIFRAIGEAFAPLLASASGPLEALRALIGQLLAGLLSITGQAIIGALNALAKVTTTAFQLIADAVRVVAALVSGDFSKAWDLAKTLVVNVVKGLLSAVDSLYPGIVGSISKMVIAVGEWLGTKLGAVWDGLKKRVEEAKSLFFGLYDAVVGHSYIPDMVDGIAHHIARLDGAMVKPIEAMTGKASKAFKEMADRTQGLLDRLFPEQAAVAKLQSDYAQLDAALAAKLITPEVYAAARDRLHAEMNKLGDEAKKSLGILVGDLQRGEADKQVDAAIMKFAPKLPDTLVAPVKAATAEVAENFARMAQDVVGAFRNLGDAIKGGDLLDILDGVLDTIATVLNALGSLGVLKGAPTQIGGGMNFGGFRAAGGPVVPGKSYIVGENGPEWFTPRMSGGITPNGGGSSTRVSIIPSPYFSAVVDNRATAVAAPIGVRAAAAGSQGAQQALARSRRQQLT